MKRNALKICMEWQCFLPKCGRCVDVFTCIEMFEHLSVSGPYMKTAYNGHTLYARTLAPLDPPPSSCHAARGVWGEGVTGTLKVLTCSIQGQTGRGAPASGHVARRITTPESVAVQKQGFTVESWVRTV